MAGQSDKWLKVFEFTISEAAWAGGKGQLVAAGKARSCRRFPNGCKGARI